MSTKTITCLVVTCDGCFTSVPGDDDGFTPHFSTIEEAVAALKEYAEDIDERGVPMYEFAPDLSHVLCFSCLARRQENACAADGGPQLGEARLGGRPERLVGMHHVPRNRTQHREARPSRRRGPDPVTPFEVAQHMVRARRPDGTPLDAGLIVAYLEHEAALAGVPVERLAPIGSAAVAFNEVMAKLAASVEGVGAAFELVMHLIRDALREPPTQSDYALA